MLLLQRMRERYLRVVAGTPDGIDLDLTLVRLPDDWLVFYAPDGEFNLPRNPDSVTKQFTKRAAKILGFAIRLHDLRVRTEHGCSTRERPFMLLPKGWATTLAFC